MYRCADQSSDVYTVKPDGTQLHKLTKPADGELDVDPTFNADGSRILFTSTRGGKAGLWQMGRDGSDAKRICDGDQGGWSPDASICLETESYFRTLLASA